MMMITNTVVDRTFIFLCIRRICSVVGVFISICSANAHGCLQMADTQTLDSYHEITDNSAVSNPRAHESIIVMSIHPPLTVQQQQQQ